jgi:pimeloyl-ACP methyl ester carboxylesterase
LFEPPGTLGSDAYWRCEEYESKALYLASQDLNYQQEIKVLGPLFNECLMRYDQRLKTQGFSSQGVLGLSSEMYVERLKMLLDNLNQTGSDYRAFHLLGTSYGTRVSMLLAEHDKVKTLVLDSAYPFSRGTLKDLPALLDHAENLHDQQYTKLIGTGSYQALFEEASRELEARPQTWYLRRWDGESDVRFVLNTSRLSDLAFSVLYDETMLSYFYQGLADVKNKPDELRWVLEDFVTTSYDPEFSSLTFAATECSDNQRISWDAFLTETQKFPNIVEDWKSIHSQDVCASILFSQTEGLQHHPYSDKPTLVFAGELDPVTPTFWTDELAFKAPDLRVINVPSVGHSVLSSSVCDVAGLIEFWKTRDTKTQIVCEDLETRDQTQQQ